METTSSSNLICHALRLRPGTELKSSLEKFVVEKGLKSAFILTCVGSVTKATLRLAQKNEASDLENEIVTLKEHFEICSLVGTISKVGCSHLHVTLGRDDGTSVSGHVMGDMEIFTTAEIVIGTASTLEFSREYDPDTKFDELVIKEDKQ